MNRDKKQTSFNVLKQPKKKKKQKKKKKLDKVKNSLEIQYRL